MLNDILRALNIQIETFKGLSYSSERYKKIFREDYFKKFPSESVKISQVERKVALINSKMKFSVLQDFKCSWNFTNSLFKRLSDLALQGKKCGEIYAFEMIIKPMIEKEGVQLSKNDFIFCFGNANSYTITKALADPLLISHSDCLTAWILEYKALNITKVNLSFLLKGRDFNKIADQMDDLQKFLDNIHANSLIDSEYKDEVIFDVIFPPKSVTGFEDDKTAENFDSGVETTPTHFDVDLSGVSG